MSGKAFNKHRNQLTYDHASNIPPFLRGLVDPDTGKPYQNASSSSRTEESIVKQVRAVKRKVGEEIADAGPSVVNIDEFSAADQAAMMQQLGVQTVNELKQIAGSGGAISDATATVQPLDSTSVKGKRNDRVGDAELDKLEAATGKPVYRPAANKATAATVDSADTPAVNHVKKAKGKARSNAKLAFDL